MPNALIGKRRKLGTSVPNVPFRTPLFQDRPPPNLPGRLGAMAVDPSQGSPNSPIPPNTAQPQQPGEITRPWKLFFERYWRPCQRTLLIKDTTVGDVIADVVTAYQSGRFKRIVGVLRKAITQDLTVRFRWVQFNQGGAIVDILTCTIPAATALYTPIIFERPSSVKPVYFYKDDPILADILASDGSTDAAGIASFTLQFGVDILP